MQRPEGTRVRTEQTRAVSVASGPGRARRAVRRARRAALPGARGRRGSRRFVRGARAPGRSECRLSHAAASPRQGHSLETVNESEGHGAGKHPVPRRLRPARGLARRSPHALLPSPCIMGQFCLRPVTVNGTHSDIPRQATGGTACAGCGGP